MGGLYAVEEKLLLALTSNQGSSVYPLLPKRHHAEADSDCPHLPNIQTVHNSNTHEVDTLYVYFPKPPTHTPNTAFPPPPDSHFLSLYWD